MKQRAGITVLCASILFAYLLVTRGAAQKPQYSAVTLKPDAAAVKTTVTAEVNVNHNSESEIAVAIPKSAIVDDVQYWCKEGANDAASVYKVAAAGDSAHGCPYQYAYWSTAIRFPEVDGASDAVQAEFFNKHSSVVRRARLVVVYH